MYNFKTLCFTFKRTGKEGSRLKRETDNQNEVNRKKTRKQNKICVKDER